MTSTEQHKYRKYTDITTMLPVGFKSTNAVLEWLKIIRNLVLPAIEIGISQYFSTAGLRPSTGPCHQLYRAFVL
jgi:hypothetical protein